MSSLARKLVSSSSRLSATQVSTQSSLARWMASRKLHMMRPLPYPTDAGVGDFLPVPALKTVVDWQKGLLERLNDLVRDTELANQNIVQTILSTALHEEHTLAFNYASLALNNNFFLENIKPISPDSQYPNHEHHISLSLGDSIRQQFGDFSQLKSTFSAAATGMSSSGWIWLVTDGTGRLAVLPTFGAGTLLIRSRRLMSKGLSPRDLGSVVIEGDPAQQEAETIEPNSQNEGTNPLPPYADGPQSSMRSSPTSGVRSSAPPMNPQTPSRSIHTSRALANTTTPASIFDPAMTNLTNFEDDEQSQIQKRLFEEISSRVFPLFCLSVHEHTWMSAGLGVWGKEEYLKRFWSVVDWEKISQTFERNRRSTTRHRK